jgi:hypothetical protein
MIREPGDFSLVVGGPLFRVLRWARLSDDNLQLLARRMAAVVVVAWLPLLILSLIEGHAWSGLRVPFLRDVDVHTRFLVALPLLFAAEWVLHQRLRLAINKFRERQLVPEAQYQRYLAALQSARTWLDSIWPEFLLLVFVYAVGLGGIWRNIAMLQADAWYGTVTDGRLVTTAAGRWLGLVSVPLFQFLLLRWYFRLLVWWRLMWQLSRTDLNLQPLHPDHAGGLGFLSQLSQAFMLLLVAQGTLASGWIAEQIFFAGAHLPEFKLELAAVTAVTVFLVLGPLLFFSPVLARARRSGLGAYGNLATRYAHDFDQKWLRGRAPENDSLIGSGDIQSLADLGNSYATLKQMRMVVFDTKTVIPLVAALLAPVAPLLLTMISVEELLAGLVKILL